MRRIFTDTTRHPIGTGAPNDVQSSIRVQGLHHCLRDVHVTIDIEHSWVNDLDITLTAPDGTSVSLVANEGGNGDNFRMTKFDDAAPASIVGQAAPFRGTFRPEGNLSDFDHLDPNGDWVLKVSDQASQDGGALQSWTLDIDDGVYL